MEEMENTETAPRIVHAISDSESDNEMNQDIVDSPSLLLNNESMNMNNSQNLLNLWRLFFYHQLSLTFFSWKHYGIFKEPILDIE